MGLFNKKKVPSELPDLALDDFEKGDKEVHDYLKKEESKNPASQTQPVASAPAEAASSPKETGSIQKEASPKIAPATTTSPAPVAKEVKVSETPAETKPVETKPSEPAPAPKPEVVKNTSPDEKSFFGNLQNNLNEEINDFTQFEEWYKDKFEKRDVIKDMKEYWEGQKTESIIKILGKSFQEKISVKISKLQELEKNWQKIYFDLIGKEEEIKEQELELKDLLSEFVKLCKTKTAEAKKPALSHKTPIALKNKPAETPKTSKSIKKTKPVSKKKAGKTSSKLAGKQDEKAKKAN